MSVPLVFVYIVSKYLHRTLVLHYALAKARPRKGVIVVPTLADGSMSRCPLVFVCRVFGCFLTSQEWLTVSLRDDKPPQGMQIKGVAQERVTVWLSPGLRTAPGRPDIVDSFRLLEAKRRQWKIEPDLGALRGAYDAYVESRGLRSQPWKRLCALVMNTDEKHKYTQENVRRLPPYAPNCRGLP